MNLNDPVKAIDDLTRAVESGQQESVARVAMSNIWPLLNSHTEQLISAVASLNDYYLERYPALRLVHPMTAVRARTTRPFKPLIYADDARSMSPEEVDFLVLTQVIAFRASGDMPAAMLYSKRLQDRLQHIPIESRDRLDGPLWYFHLQIGSTLLAAGESGPALLEFATARQLGKMSAQSDAERVCLSRISLAHAVRGALADSERALAEAQSLPTPTLAHLTTSLSSENTAAALIAVDRMAPDVTERLGALEPFDTNNVMWPFALLARTRAFLGHHRPEDALEAIRLSSNAHPVHPRSAAHDVICATSIKARMAMGDLAAARRNADDAAQPGTFTSLATVRLALREGQLEAAAQALRVLSRDQTLGPGQWAESVLLSAWLEFALTDDLSRETALQLFRVIRQADHRRLIEVLPRQLVEHMRNRVTIDVVQEFDEITSGHVYFDADPKPDLTGGELRVLNALLSYPSTASMAEKFHVSPNTIKSQLRSLYRKLGCSTREDAIRIATQLHLLSAKDEL